MSDYTPEEVLAWLKKNHAYAYVMCRPLSFTVEEIERIINAFNDMKAPAEVSDKRQDRIVADEPQLSREQIDDMNSGD